MEVESTDETEAEGEDEETGDGSSKKGYSQRVRQVVNERNEARKEAESLKARIDELTKSNQPNIDFQFQQQADEPLIKPGEEIDALELDRRLKAREQQNNQKLLAQVDLKNKQAEAINRINLETAEVMQKFPELNPESDEYNQDLSESITDATEAYIKSNPYSASVKDFVAKLMKPYKGAIDKQVGKATETMAKQVSQSALKPTSVKQGEKSAAEKSIAELEQELGIVQS